MVVPQCETRNRSRLPRTRMGDSSQTRQDAFVLSLSVIIGKWKRHLSLLWQPWGRTTAIRLPQGSSPDVNHAPVTTGTPGYKEHSLELFTDGGASHFGSCNKKASDLAQSGSFV